MVSADTDHLRRAFGAAVATGGRQFFIGLASYQANSDSDREWLGRAAGWLSAGAIAWAIVAFLVFFAGGYFLPQAPGWISQGIAAGGGLSGIVIAFLGRSSKTAANAMSTKADRIGKTYRRTLDLLQPL